MSDSRQYRCRATPRVENVTVYTTTQSPVGELLLAGEQTPDGVRLTSVSMTGQRTAPAPRDDWRRAPAAFGDVIRQLQAYFAGELTVFDLELAPGGTPFQQRVWRALDSVRYGTTITYGELAAQLGVPRDRIPALGAAIGQNPLLIVRPCHRVIGADGLMRGYAGGVERKQWLLVHEGALQPMLG
jgi:methylated-DNA-[protein]-cysteine S-methyltransferase